MARLLVVDDDGETLTWMAAALGRAGHEVKVASSAQQALSVLDRWTPDLALVDILMPEMDGWAFSRMARRYRVPILFVSILRGGGEAILRGCTGLLSKPTTPEELRAAVRRVLETTGSQLPILLVDDDFDVRSALASILQPSFSTREAENGQKALELLRREPVALVITDVRMPVMDGRELVRRIRRDLGLTRLPILVQSADPEALRLPLWSELQVEQVMSKTDFADWLLSRIDMRLSEVNANGAPS